MPHPSRPTRAAVEAFLVTALFTSTLLIPFLALPLGTFADHLNHTTLFTPAIVFLALLASLTFSALVARTAYRSARAKLRLAAGLCPYCCYDLRSTPTRCPECGRRPATR